MYLSQSVGVFKGYCYGKIWDSTCNYKFFLTTVTIYDVYKTPVTSTVTWSWVNSISTKATVSWRSRPNRDTSLPLALIWGLCAINDSTLASLAQQKYFRRQSVKVLKELTAQLTSLSTFLSTARPKRNTVAHLKLSFNDYASKSRS